MRRVEIQVGAGRGEDVRSIAEELGAISSTVVRSDGERDLVIAVVENHTVGPLLEAAGDVAPIEARWHPSGVLSLTPPAGEQAEQLLDVTQRTPIEIVLAGRMSAGSWTGMLTFAALAGAVVWVGLTTETWYLLTAAMLLAPFAGPAMNAAIATAHGDVGMLGHAVSRYFGSILATAAVAFVLQLAFGIGSPTPFMVQIVSVSGLAVLLPITAGVAGALYLIQSEHSSLVSGAAVGMLVAASLAPPAGMLGTTLAMGSPGLAGRAFFVLVLQLVGIELTATAAFRWSGVRPDTPRMEAPHRWLAPVATGVAAVAVAGLLVLQFSSPPDLRRLSLEGRAVAEVDAAIDQSGIAELVDIDVAYGPMMREPALVATVQVLAGADAPADVEDRIRTLVVDALTRVDGTAQPLADVTVLRAP